MPETPAKSLTPRQKLILAAARSCLNDLHGSSHPTLGTVRYGDMTDEELQQVILWHEEASKKQ